MIEARELRKRFGRVDALDGVSFLASDARITGLLGPNGAGKSTTLRILYATLAADSGSACVDGDTVSVANTRQPSAGPGAGRPITQSSCRAGARR